MPVLMHYDPERRVNTVTVSDPFALEDLEQALQDLTGSSAHPADVDAIWDCRQVDFRPISRDNAESLADLRTRFPARGDARVAIVVDGDLGFGMARMFEMLAADILAATRVCRSLAEAEAWLSED